MRDSVVLLAAPENPAAARTVRGLVELTEALLPTRAVAYYLCGSHRDGRALPTSDVDVVVVLRPGVPERERTGLARALGILSESAAVPADVVLAGEDELRRTGAVWLRDHAALIYGTDVAGTFVPLSPREYVRIMMHGALTNALRLYPPGVALRYPLPPPDPADVWLGYARRRVRRPDGSEGPGTAALVTNVFWAAKALALLHGGDCIWGKSEVIVRSYRERVADAWADFLDGLLRRCRGEWGYLIPEAGADRATLRALCEQSHQFFNHFLDRYRTFLLNETAEGMPARQLAVRRLGLVGYADAEVRATLFHLTRAEGPLAAEARAALDRLGR